MKDTGKKEKGLTDRDYEYIMGVTKKRLGLPTKPVESVAEAIIASKVFESSDYDVRVFRDLEGDVSFASLDDVHIDPNSDVRVLLLHRLANEQAWPHNHPFPESIEGYEGSIKELTKRVIELLSGQQV